MLKFFEKEMINCLCCGNLIRKPLEAQTVRCSKCFSEITARRENSPNQSSWKVLALISVVPILSLFFGHYFADHHMTFVFLSIFIVIILNKYFFGSYFFNPKLVIKYVYVNGHSFPEEVRLRKERLNLWLGKAESDFIGFIRYLYSTDYVWKGLNFEQQKVLMELHAKMDTLPSQDQISGWSSDHREDDLKRIDALKDEYSLQLGAIVESLDGVSLDFQPEALD
ncbi:hypothetical protein [Thalassolituus sp.]|uniref:hypothetical protein n=1 Tax=Thalassolituus sp. TaxID=2030822 RepID=UPI0035127E2E